MIHLQAVGLPNAHVKGLSNISHQVRPNQSHPIPDTFVKFSGLDDDPVKAAEVAAIAAKIEQNDRLEIEMFQAVRDGDIEKAQQLLKQIGFDNLVPANHEGFGLDLTQDDEPDINSLFNDNDVAAIKHQNNLRYGIFLGIQKGDLEEAQGYLIQYDPL